MSVDREKNDYLKEQYRSSDNLFDLNPQKKQFYSNYSKYEYTKPYLEMIFFLHVIEFSCRFCAFILYSIRIDKYLDEVARRSYSIITGKDHFKEEYDGFIQNILKYYSVTMNWSWWLQLSSLILSFASIGIIVIFFIFNVLINLWNKWQNDRINGQINEFVNNESYFNRFD